MCFLCDFVLPIVKLFSTSDHGLSPHLEPHGIVAGNRIKRHPVLGNFKVDEGLERASLLVPDIIINAHAMPKLLLPCSRWVLPLGHVSSTYPMQSLSVLCSCDLVLLNCYWLR